jgi:3-methylcrotonyl-CoA carboxylase alpha subunit
MFDKILIANRGEIACRVIKTARRLGIRTVAVYSDADRSALHVSMADEAVHIGASPSRESYLVSEKIIAAAKTTGAQAIHPGYGFLSENADFCRQCQAENLVFIGPPTSAIEAMGSKSAAKNLMEAAGVPLVPGYHGDDQNPELIRKSADEMGYPVLLKAVAGGGGKGMRQVWSPEEFDEALLAAKREASSSFGNDDMLVEKYLTRPRHVEVQVFCDQKGNGVYLFERDCSIQRRHQKVIEEAPAPNMPEGLREEMGEAAVRAAQAIDYVGAGTVEFLLDEDGSFYFMEMNTRLQVEHPVTEFITKQDLVEWQLRVAAGEQLPLTQEQLQINGHSLEVRIYAEDPDNDFLPVTGKLNFLRPPKESEHVRVDTGVIQGDDVSIYYDPMIAKLIVWDENRDRALARLARALSEYRIRGVVTNIPFLYNLATCAPFKQVDLDTGFIEKHKKAIFHEQDVQDESLIPLACLYLMLYHEQCVREAHMRDDLNSPWNAVNGWRLNASPAQEVSIISGGIRYDLIVEEQGSLEERRFSISWNNHIFQASGILEGQDFYADIDGLRKRTLVSSHEGSHCLFAENGALEFELVLPDYGDDTQSEKSGGFVAPMNGTIVQVLVEPGQLVKAGDTLLIMEAMKMEHAIQADTDGEVTEVYYQTGDLVDGGASLLQFEPASGESA